MTVLLRQISYTRDGVYHGVYLHTYNLPYSSYCKSMCIVIMIHTYLLAIIERYVIHRYITNPSLLIRFQFDLIKMIIFLYKTFV